MTNTSSLINIFLYMLPGKIAQSMHREYEWRKMEIQRIWNNENNSYSVLQNFASTIDALLTLSLYYRYIVSKFDGVSAFYVNVNRGCTAETPITIGKFTFDSNERRRLLAIHIQFSQLVDKYQISSHFFEYADTLGFLRNCLDLYHTPEQNDENDTF
ncbi:MAG: hypothetical protein MJ003_05160 [Paludibacteraceae bacterium]|nr:hypothetical protein [Paludibacteraceae bacterium]